MDGFGFPDQGYVRSCFRDFIALSHLNEREHRVGCIGTARFFARTEHKASSVRSNGESCTFILGIQFFDSKMNLLDFLLPKCFAAPCGPY